MIIKVLPRKGGFSKTLSYITRDKGRITDHRAVGIFHNVRTTKVKELVKEFKANFANYTRNVPNKNTHHHIILSYSPLDRAKIGLEMMDELARKYIEKAVPDSLAVAVHHLNEEDKHLHTHICASATSAIKKNVSVGFNKTELRSIHLEMEQYIAERYPELTSSLINTKTYGQRNHSEAAYYQKKRNPGQKLQIEELSEQVKSIFRNANSSQDFYRQLQKAGLATYDYRNRTNGVLLGEGAKKVRFSRLGIEQEEIRLLDKINSRLQELEDIRNIQSKQRGLSQGDGPELDIS